METLQSFISMLDFFGDELTHEQAERFMDQAKRNLSISDIEIIMNHPQCPGEFYTQVSEYNAEMGGLMNY